MARRLASLLCWMSHLSQRLGRRIGAVFADLRASASRLGAIARPAVPLDEIFYLGLSPRSPYYEDENRRYQSVLESLVLFFRGMLAASRTPRSLVTLPRAPCDVMFCGSTYNQHVALRPVADRIPNAAVVGLGCRHGRHVSDFRAFVLSLSSLPGLVRYVGGLEGRPRRVAQHQFADFLLAQGYLRMCEEILQRLHPRVVVVANDHSMRPVVMRLACARLGIRTAYVQHASVADRFPPLRFTLSFLDGCDAAHKYDFPESVGATVFLSGMAKADGIRQWLAAGNRRTTMQLGICVKPADEADRVLRFVELFRMAYPDYSLLVRPHPQDDRPWQKLGGVDVRRHESSFDFLKQVDAIVSGSSGILLEAALAGIPAVQFGFRSVPDRDYFGFAGRGLVSAAHSPTEACELLANGARHGPRPSMVQALTFYCASVGTHYDGHVAALIAETLLEATKGRVGLSGWIDYERLNYLSAYRLRQAQGPQRYLELQRSDRASVDD